jgi:outer membrane protein
VRCCSGRSRWVLLLALLVAVPLFPALASRASLDAQAPPTLSLKEAVELALSSNPGLQLVRNDLITSEWDLRSAYGALLPSASVNGGADWQGSGEQRVGSLTLGELGASQQPSYLFSSYGFSVNYSLNGSTLLAPSQNRANLNATDARIRSEEASLILQVTQRYLDALRQEEALVLARRELEGAEFNLRLAQARTELGSGSPLDERQAAVSVGRARISVLQSETAGRTARIRLLTSIGLNPRPGLQLTTRFQVAFPAWTAEELIALALDGNPGLSALRAGTTAAEVGVQSARSAYLPTLSLSAGISGFARQATDSEFLVDQARSNVERSFRACQSQNELYARLTPPLPPQDCSALQFTDDQANRVRANNQSFPFDFTRQPASLSLRLSLPLFQGFNRQRQVEAARVVRDDSRLRVRQEEIRLRGEVTAALDAVETARASAELEEQNVALADEQLRLAQEQYRVGAASFLQLVESETLKARADREWVAAIFAFHDTVAALEALVGVSLRTR